MKRAFALVFVVACTTTPAIVIPPVTMAVVPPMAPPAPPAPPPSGPTFDAALEAKLTEIHRLRDWRSSVAGTQMLNPPNAARAKPLAKTGEFPLARVASIRAYHFRHNYAPWWASDWGGGDEGEEPYAKDGSLNGHVTPPEAVLSTEERDGVVAALRQLETSEQERMKKGWKTPSLRCMFDAHHAFVFFDEHDVPIGKLIVCFTCGEFYSVPRTAAFGDIAIPMLPDDLRAALEHAADAHGLGAWTYGEGEELKAVGQYANQRYGPSHDLTALGEAEHAREHARPSGAPPNESAATAPKADRDLFCVWLRAEIAGRSAEIDRITGGRICPKDSPNAGMQWAFDDESPHDHDCFKARICDAPFEKLEACLRASFLTGDPETMCREGASPKCAGMLDCLPYLDRQTLH